MYRREKNKGNYDRVALFYDTLAAFVFGGAIAESQVALLHTIKASSSVLIAGGGTGWVLDEISKLHPKGLSITYVELSARMIAKAKERNVAGNRVTFVQMPVQEFDLLQKYDVVITAFLFDNFSEETQQAVFDKLHGALKSGGVWLFTDFKDQQNQWWQPALLKGMYFFFNLLCGLEANQLINTEHLFEQQNYSVQKELSFCKGFITSVAYKKQ
jgi:ubiquinone/menaquinone biosynthesis C-methylase UbiE